ncbi:RNA 2',3'-cyclic phosphodiesterase [Candidatus Marsarchaeota archaeon]|nr:RNA 2',3'-cyclic phosphodiesterase [Candidatus Marsarchaeota archaeon]
MRAFIAFEIPERIRELIAKALLGAGAKYGIKIIPQENMHITIGFLGEISEESASEVSGIMASVNAAKFNAAFGKISTFGSHSSVAFMGMDIGDKEAIAMHGLLYGKLSRLSSIKLENSKFFPHMSVARGLSKNLNAFAAGMQKDWARSETFTIGKLALKKSVLGAANARYETIFEKELS